MADYNKYRGGVLCVRCVFEYGPTVFFVFILGKRHYGLTPLCDSFVLCF